MTPEGVYESPIENVNRRFFTMLGTLITGRVCVGGAGINASKVALAIAVKYALRRRQFEAVGEEEQLILDYGMYQRRLFPLLARTYALNAAQAVLATELHDVLTEGVEGRQASSRARVAGRRDQGAGHLARDAHDPGVPRGLRWCGLPRREPVRGAEGRHRRLHDLRG